MLYLELVSLFASIFIASVCPNNFGATSSALCCFLDSTPSKTGFDIRLYEYDFMDSLTFLSVHYIDCGYLSNTFLGANHGHPSIYL